MNHCCSKAAISARPTSRPPGNVPVPGEPLRPVPIVARMMKMSVMIPPHRGALTFPLLRSGPLPLPRAGEEIWGPFVWIYPRRRLRAGMAWQRTISMCPLRLGRPGNSIDDLPRPTISRSAQPKQELVSFFERGSGLAAIVRKYIRHVVPSVNPRNKEVKIQELTSWQAANRSRHGRPGARPRNEVTRRRSPAVT